MKEGHNLYLCIEYGQRFYVQATSDAEAKEYASIWGAEMIKQVPNSYLTKNPNTIKL